MRPHKNAYWCIPPKENAEFVACMEDILDIYEMPYSPAVPVVCMDEKPYQMLGEARELLAMRPGDTQKMDCEYVRNGACSIFVFVEPLGGIRCVSVWEDLDIQSGMLDIRRTLNRLGKMKKPAEPGESSTEIVIQEPKTQNSIRSIPLLPAVVQDLIAWHNIQRNDQAVAGNDYHNSGMIVTNPLGGYIEPYTFKDQYHQILKLAGLRHFTVHDLRYQNVKPKTKINLCTWRKLQMQRFKNM